MLRRGWVRRLQQRPPYSHTQCTEIQISIVIHATNAAHTNEAERTTKTSKATLHRQQTQKCQFEQVKFRSVSVSMFYGRLVRLERRRLCCIAGFFPHFVPIVTEAFRQRSSNVQPTQAIEVTVFAVLLMLMLLSWFHAFVVVVILLPHRPCYWHDCRPICCQHTGPNQSQIRSTTASKLAPSARTRPCSGSNRIT